MGNAALRQLAVIDEISFDAVAGSVIAVDAHNWLYRYLTTTVKFTRDAAYTTDEGEAVPNLIGVMQGIPKFYEHELIPVFVFDGAVTELKDAEVSARRAARESAAEQQAAAEERGDHIEAARLSARTQRLTPVILETTRTLLEHLDVPVVEAPAEGEAQAAAMAERGDVDLVGSEDYDTLLFGAPYTLRQLTSAGAPELMELEATLRGHQITREQLVDVAMLIGTDFNEGISGMGPKTAMRAVKEHGDLFGVMEADELHIPQADRIRSLFFDPPMTARYRIPTSVDPDLEAARAFVCDTWEVDPSEVDRGFDRLAQAVVQTGLDRWT
ncbi:MAG: flap endonuclease-1 [Haloquadratum sp.]|nr:flap endonuclease-1 [Haloquadratum sp.]